MMRVVGKVGFVAVALSLIATASVYATPALEMTNSAIPTAAAVGPRTFMGTGFEASEGYVIGSLSTQQGWACNGLNNAPPPGGPGPGCPGTQVGPGPLNNGVIVAKGNGSGQSWFLTQNLNFPNNTLRGGFSPNFKDFTQDTMNIDYRMNDNFGADYYIIPQAPSEGLRITNILLYYTGAIKILEDLDGQGPGTSFGYRTVGQWAQNTWQTLEMKLDKNARTFTVSQGADKQHQTPLCYTVLGNPVPVCTFSLGGAGVGFGDQFEMVVVASDNNQNTGFGSFSNDGLDQPGLYIDNIRLKPEPGSLALLAAGALLALRRKTAR